MTQNNIKQLWMIFLLCVFGVMNLLTSSTLAGEVPRCPSPSFLLKVGLGTSLFFRRDPSLTKGEWKRACFVPVRNGVFDFERALFCCRHCRGCLQRWNKLKNLFLYFSAVFSSTLFLRGFPYYFFPLNLFIWDFETFINGSFKTVEAMRRRAGIKLQHSHHHCRPLNPCRHHPGEPRPAAESVFVCPRKGDEIIFESYGIITWEF